MRKALLVVLVSFTSSLSAQTALSGEWSGHWIRADDSLPVTVRFHQDAATKTYTAAFDSDRLRVSGIPFDSVTVRGCCAVTMRLVGDRTTTVFTGAVRGNTMSGTFREGETEGRFTLVRSSARSPTLSEREVTFTNGDVSLAGTLILPSSTGRHPVVLFLHGSGGEGRWANRFLATTFARHGIAALIFDKRGVGKSTGDWRTASIDDLAGDAIAAIAFLRADSAILPDRIGIHGHSQGGTLAPMIAARSPGVAFVIASAAAGTPTDSTEIYSILNSIYPNAQTAGDSADARAYTSAMVMMAYHGGSRGTVDSLAARYRDRPWYFAPPPIESSYWRFSRDFGAFHPLEWWRQVNVPVLLVYGAADQRVPAGESAARIVAELTRSRNSDVAVRIFPRADHTFRLPPGPSGWPVTAPGYVETLLDWLAHR